MCVIGRGGELHYISKRKHRAEVAEVDCREMLSIVVECCGLLWIVEWHCVKNLFQEERKQGRSEGRNVQKW